MRDNHPCVLGSFQRLKQQQTTHLVKSTWQGSSSEEAPLVSPPPSLGRGSGPLPGTPLLGWAAQGLARRQQGPPSPHHVRGFAEGRC